MVAEEGHMIIETIIWSFTTITCSSLWLANRVHKREFEDDVNPTKVTIYPFEKDKIFRSMQCKVCGTRRWYHSLHYAHAGGPYAPKSCNDDNCPATSHKHVHVTCKTCNATYFMKTFK